MADGYILIDTEISTAGLKKGVSVLEREINKTTASLEKQRAKLQGYFDELDGIKASTDEMLKLANTTEEVTRILEIEQGEIDVLNGKYKEQLDTLNKTEELLEGQKAELEMTKEAVIERVEAEKQSASAAKDNAQAAEEVGDAYDKIPAKIDDANSRLNTMNNTLKSALKNIIKYGLGVGGALALFNKLKSAAKEGLEMVAESDERAKAAMDAMNGAFDNIKRALGQAIVPLVEALAPIVEAFVPLMQALAPIIEALVPILNALVPLVRTIAELVQALLPLLEALTPILQIIAAVLNAITWVLQKIVGAVQSLFGLSSNDRSYKAVENLANHYSDVEESAVGASAAIKEMQRNLSGLDEINTFEKQNAALGGGGGGSVPSVTTPDLNIDAENVNIDGGEYTFSDTLAGKAASISDAILKALPDWLFDYDYWNDQIAELFGDGKGVSWVLEQAFSNPGATFENVVDYMSGLYNDLPDWLKTLLTIFNPGFVGITEIGNNIVDADGKKQILAPDGWREYGPGVDSVFSKAGSDLTDVEKKYLEDVDEVAEWLPEWLMKAIWPDYKNPTDRAWQDNKTYQYERDPITGATTDIKKEEYKTPAEKAWENNKTYQYERDPITGATLDEKKRAYEAADQIEESYYNKKKGRYLDLQKEDQKTTNELKKSLNNAQKATKTSVDKANKATGSFYNKTKERFLDLGNEGSKTASGTSKSAEEAANKISRTTDTFYNKTKKKYLQIEEETGKASQNTLNAAEKPFSNDALGQFADEVYGGVKDKFTDENNPANFFGDKSQDALDSVEGPYKGNTLGSYFNGVYQGVKNTVNGENSPDKVFGGKSEKALESVKNPYKNRVLENYFSDVYDEVKGVASGNNSPDTVFGGKATQGVNAVKGAVTEGKIANTVSGAYTEVKNTLSGSNSPDTVFGGKAQAGVDAAKKAIRGGDIKSAVSGIYSDIKNVFTGSNDPGTVIGGKFSGVGDKIAESFTGAKSKIATAFSGAWEAVTGAFPGNGNKVGDWFASNVGSPIAKTMRDYLNKIIDMINLNLKSLNRTRTGVSNTIGAAVAQIQLLNYIPAFASGAVIPPNAPFVGIMGDQKHGTNIETPEDLLRKIVREEAGSRGGGVYEFSATINRKTLFDEVVEEAKIRKKISGKNPLVNL